MHMTVEEITEEALGLPSEARALLADRLAESLDPAEDGYVRQLWMREARRRIDEVRSGDVKTIPADEAFAQVRQFLGDSVKLRRTIRGSSAAWATNSPTPLRLRSSVSAKRRWPGG